MQPFDPLAAPLEGTRLIEASAGTGKTFTIGTLYLRALVEHGLQPRSILVVTYTKAATAELRQRLRDRVRDAFDALGDTPRADGGGGELQQLVDAWTAAGLGDRARAALRSALASFDEAAVYTIHGFCQRMLDELAFESGVPFECELVTDEEPLRDEIVRDFWAHATYAAPPPLLQLLRRDLTLDRLLGLAMRVAGNPRLPIVPDSAPTAGTSLDEALAEQERALTVAAAIWERDRAEIVTLLHAPALNKNKYRPATIEGQWVPALDALLRSEPGAPIRSDKWKDLRLERLTTEGMRDGTKKNQAEPSHEFFGACDALQAAHGELRAALGRERLRLCLDLVDFVRTERRRRRDATRTRAFDDLQLLLHDALHGDDGTALAASIRRRFPFALIDECQDTDPLQHAIFDRIYRDDPPARDPTGIYRIGDPKQAIFAFRGADVFTYLAARRAVPDAPQTLLTNWRSDPAVVEAVNALFGRPHAPFVLQGIEPHPIRPRPNAANASSDSGLHFLLVPGMRDAPKDEAKRRVIEGTAAEIRTLLTPAPARSSEPDVRARDVAVLCRTNQQAIDIQDALRRVGVPSVLRGDKSVFDTAEAEELQRLAQAIASPSDAAAVRSALATSILGVDGPALHGLQHDEHAWDDWTRRFDRWHGLWTSHRFVRAFRQLAEECDVHARLLGITDGERRLTNLLHLVELVHRAETSASRGPAQTLRWLQQMRLDPQARGAFAGDAEQIRLESDEDAVTLVTIHKSKGLEYPVVYCPFLWESARPIGADRDWIRFHDPDDAQRAKLDIGSDDQDEHATRAAQEILAESLRLTYVALTRAKHRCSVVWGAFKSGHGSPLAYLLHQPPDPDAIDDLPAATATRMKSLDDDAVRRELETLVAAAPGAITVRDLADAPTSSRTPVHPDRTPPAPLRARQPSPAIPVGRRVSSFSALVADTATSTPRLEEGIDHDQSDRDDPLRTDPGAPAAPATPAIFDTLRPGAATGQLLHAMLEHVDFDASARSEVERLAAGALARHGFPTDLARPVAGDLLRVLRAPLGVPGGPARLADIARVDRRSEMPFVLPAAHSLTVKTLAETFARHRAAGTDISYDAYAAQLRFEPLRGHLRGFIDLVFRFDGRWYVVDYKSNHLGPSQDDYAPPRLRRAMVEHHYVLQSHLYALAVHRHLETRLPDYDYARDFGGILYLFVRGMGPTAIPGQGVFYDRPAPALLADLSTLVATP